MTNRKLFHVLELSPQIDPGPQGKAVGRLGFRESNHLKLEGTHSASVQTVYSRVQSTTCRFSPITFLSHTLCTSTDCVLNNVVYILERTCIPLDNSNAYTSTSHTQGFPVPLLRPSLFKQMFFTGVNFYTFIFLYPQVLSSEFQMVENNCRQYS